MSILADLLIKIKEIMKFLLVFFLFFTGFILSGCTTLDLVPDVMHPVSKVFHTDYEKTWRATMLALEDYPIEVENNEKGYLKTESIQSETIWKFPFERDSIQATEKYTIYIKLIKGEIDSRSVVKVSILKKILVQKGFIEEPKRVPSNGLEEKALLYRIFREINIEQAITNYHQKSSS